MKNKFRDAFHSYMVRPLIYQCVAKCAIAFVIALLWKRWINRSEAFSIIEDAFFVIGIIFILLSWFQYLSLDGIHLPHLLGGPKKKPKRRGTRDIVDFADEKIIAFSELESEERTVVRLFSDIIAGVIFLIPALIATVL